MPVEIIKNELEYIKKKHFDTPDKRAQIIEDLELLLQKDSELLNLEKKNDQLIRAQEKSIVNYGIDEDWGRKMYDAFAKPIFDLINEYEKEYYDFMFGFHKTICAPKLDNNKQIKHFNYLIPLGDLYKISSPRDKFVDHPDVRESYAIDTEFYQIDLIRAWSQYQSNSSKALSYREICSLFINNFGNFHYSDIALTASSRGKSRVENSLDINYKIFRKTGIIDKRNLLTNFGLFLVKLVDIAPKYELQKAQDYRGIKSINKLLAKPLNDLIFNFDVKDFEKLNISLADYEDLISQLQLYKSDPKNIEILNMPNYRDF